MTEKIETRVVKIKGDLTQELKSLFDELNLGNRFLVVTGNTKTKELTESWTKEIPSYEFEVMPVKDSQSSTGVAAQEIAQREGIKGVIGAGGGKAIDVAKYAASNTKKPFVSFPYSPSHDGIASPLASIKGEIQHSLKASPPVAVVVYPHFILESPYELFTAGLGDIVAKLSSSQDLKLAYEEGVEKDLNFLSPNELYQTYQKFGNVAKKLLRRINEMEKYSEEKAAQGSPVEGGPEHPHLVKFAFDLIEAEIESGQLMIYNAPEGIFYSSRGASGAEHLFAHVFEMKPENSVKHGHLTGVGAVVSLFLYEEKLGIKPHGVDWRDVRRKFRYMRMPTRAVELGISSEEMVQALPEALQLGKNRLERSGKGRFTILDYLNSYHEPKIYIDTITSREFLTKTDII